jgi:hypothetical protein
MKTKRPYNRPFSIICPDCAGKLLIRTSEQVTPTVREMLLWCDNDACGARFVGQLSLMTRVQHVMPAAVAVILPVRPWHPSNDNRVPANDGPIDSGPGDDAAVSPPAIMTG